MEPVNEYLWIIIAIVVSFIISLFFSLKPRENGLVVSCNYSHS